MRFETHSEKYAQALACYVLAMLGERNVSLPPLEWMEMAAPKANALVAMAAKRLQNDVVFKHALLQLMERANESAEECTWGTIEDTAWALRALLCAETNEGAKEASRLRELSDKAANWLLMQRTGSFWISTRQTAMAIMALVEYLKRHRWTPPSGTLTISLNGKERKLAVEPRQAHLGDLKLRIPATEAKEGDNKLALNFDGNGTLYYTVVLNCMRRIDAQVRLISSGDAVVTRQYELVRYGKDGKKHEVALEELNCRKESILKCTLTIRSKKPLNYILVEEPLPAGCEVIERGELERDEWDLLGLLYAERDVRDDKIVFFIRELQPTTMKLTYELRAECAGKFAILPTVVSAMYEPGIIARGSPQVMVVR